MSDRNILLQRAKSAVVARDYVTAVRLYKNLIADDPYDRDLKIQLGHLYVKSGDDDNALGVFNGIIQSDPENICVPENVDILIAIGGIYRRQKKYDESIEILGQAQKAGGGNSKTQGTVSYNLGFTYRQMGKLKEAIDCFEDVVAANPNDVLAFNHLGAIYALEKKHDKAIVAYQKGLKTDPNHPVLLLNLAKSYEANKENQKALSAYEAALRSKPGWDEAIDGYSDLLMSSNRVKEADDILSNALKINPDDVKMRTKMGHVYNRQSIYESAELQFKKALEIDDGYKSALTGMAFSQEKLGKNSEAVKTIQKAVELNPDDVDVLKQSAQILISANYLSAAYEKISHLWKLDQNDVQTVNLLGQYYICKGDEAKVESCFDKIQRIDPEYKEVFKDWGKRFAQKGDMKTAVEYLKAAVEENPDDSNAKVDLATIYERQGKNSEALALYKDAIAKDIHNVLSRNRAAHLETAVKKEDLNADFEIPSDAESEISMDNEEIENPEEDEEEIKIEINKTEETVESKEVENTILPEQTKDSEEFEFDQFGMENLAEEDDGKTFDQLLSLEDNMDDIFNDIDDLVDDGAPVDADEDDSEVMPDGSEDLDMSSLPEDFADNSSIDYDLFEDEDINEDEPVTQLPKTFEPEEIPEPKEEEKKKSLDDIPAKEPRNPYEDYAELNKRLEDAERSAFNANAAAENAFRVAQRAAEEAAKAKVTERIIEREVPKEEPKEENELKKAIDMLPAIVGAIEDKKMLEKFKASVDMFKKLREMLEFLPPAKKKQFFTSKNRILLDYIISRLSGKPGLLATVNALINSGLVSGNENAKASDKTGLELVAQVLTDVQNLSSNVKDEYLRDALDSEVLSLLEKIRQEQEE